MVPVRSSTVATAYLYLQGTLSLAWWALLLAEFVPRNWFFMSDEVMRSFLVPDVVMFSTLSFVSGRLVQVRSSHATLVLGIHTGGVFYASAYALSQALLDTHYWLGGALMLPPLVIVPWILFVVWAQQAKMP